MFQIAARFTTVENQLVNPASFANFASPGTTPSLSTRGLMPSDGVVPIQWLTRYRYNGWLAELISTKKGESCSELIFMFVNKAQFVFVLQLNPGNSNCQRKLKLLRVIGLSSYKGFEQKTRNTWFKRFNAYTRIIVTLNFEGKKKHVIDLKSELGKTDKWWQITDWFQITRHYFSSPGRTVKTVCLRTYKSCDIGKGKFVIIYNWY